MFFWGVRHSPSSMRGRPERLAFSRCSTTRLLLMRRARATKGAEWSSRGVLRASRYCRQFVCGEKKGGGRVQRTHGTLGSTPRKGRGPRGCWGKEGAAARRRAAPIRAHGPKMVFLGRPAGRR